jgi:arylsulfatase A-like enzyme
VTHRSPALPLLLWSSAYAGCAAFLLASLSPQAPPSVSLAGQLSWLALIGSVPTTLLLGAASRAARARTSVAIVTALLLGALAATVGWEHTESLLSGPQWAVHPRRVTVRVLLDASLAVLGSAGWLWLIWGMRIGRRAWLAVWMAATALAAALLATVITRYRAYDHTIAQLVLPAGLLSGAMVFAVARRSAIGFVVVGMALTALPLGVLSRLVPSLAATGERELIAYSRSGALVTLYVIPHWGGRSSPWSPTGEPCPRPRSEVQDAPTGIAPHKRRNVILVTVDALRKDAVEAAVNDRPVMPELSRLCGQGVCYQNATSTYPATLFALGSAFTGLSPAELFMAPALPETIFSRSRPHLDRQIVVLPEVSWFRLPIVAQLLAPAVEPAFAANDAAATDAMVERLRAARAEGASVMAWIHYYSPHDPYVARRRFLFGASKTSAYLGEVAYFDAALGRLLDYLREDGWLDDSLVIFFSDHGEALGEGGYWGHHVYLNGWMIDVPLMIWHADLAPARPRAGVSLSDVAPTVLHFLGLPIPSDIAAQSLFTLDPDQVDRPSFSEAFPVRGIELFDSFRLPALDDKTILQRLRGIRVANAGYEPKGSVTSGAHRLIHHRAADAWLLYERESLGPETPVDENREREVGRRLRAELEQWEHGQLRRIECRLKVGVDSPTTARR